MKLGSVRDYQGLREVLMDQDRGSAADVYWVFTDISDHEQWFNVTLIATGRFGNEFTKTHGHYHADNAPPETYKLIEGEGVLVLQKKDLSVVYLVKAKAGDEIVITKEYGHAWVNIGKLPLISFDDWRVGHTPGDYEQIKEKHGMAFYLIEERGKVKAIPNPNYPNLPEPVWLTAEEFSKRF